MRYLFLLLSFVLACEGPVGPEGPMGPQGLQGLAGEPGPGTRFVQSVQMNSNGEATIDLPTAAGTNPTNPPAMSCYISDDLSGVWLQVSDGWGSDTTRCGLVFVPNRGAFSAAIWNSAPRWWALFVVVY